MARWTALVFLDGANISARVTGTVRIEAEESVSRLAQFTMKPLTGAINVDSWVGSAVAIHYVDDPEGTLVQTQIFAGIANLADYDLSTGLVTISCTDNLQGFFESKTLAEILALIPSGKYADEVFGPREDGWQQALDVLKTVPKAFNLTGAGESELTSWDIPGPTVTYTASQILNSTLDIELMRARDIVNQVTIDFQYRYTRLHHREHGFGWNWGTTFCDYFSFSHQLPNRDMVQAAANGAGWTVQGGLAYDTLPESGVYNCGGSVVWDISSADLGQIVINAAWTAVKRWSQTVTEKYTIVMSCAASQALFGVHVGEDGVGFQTDYDDAQWDTSIDANTPAWAVNVLGDYTEDQLDRVASDNVIETMMQLASTKIKATHRRSYLKAKVLIDPGLELSDSARINTANVDGTAKVFRMIHEMNINSGSATTEVTVAISRGGGLDTLIDAPLPPDTAPIHAPPVATTVLPTRIGNDDTVAVYDADWVGFTGNFTVPKGTPTAEQVYAWRMRVVTPAIEAVSRDELIAIQIDPLETEYSVLCPQDTLTISG